MKPRMQFSVIELAFGLLVGVAVGSFATQILYNVLPPADNTLRAEKQFDREVRELHQRHAKDVDALYARSAAAGNPEGFAERISADVGELNNYHRTELLAVYEKHGRPAPAWLSTRVSP